LDTAVITVTTAVQIALTHSAGTQSTQAGPATTPTTLISGFVSSQQSTDKSTNALAGVDSGAKMLRSGVVVMILAVC
jgi:hypothetical protein